MRLWLKAALVGLLFTLAACSEKGESVTVLSRSRLVSDDKLVLPTVVSQTVQQPYWLSGHAGSQVAEVEFHTLAVDLSGTEGLSAVMENLFSCDSFEACELGQEDLVYVDDRWMPLQASAQEKYAQMPKRYFGATWHRTVNPKDLHLVERPLTNSEEHTCFFELAARGILIMARDGFWLLERPEPDGSLPKCLLDFQMIPLLSTQQQAKISLHQEKNGVILEICDFRINGGDTDVIFGERPRPGYSFSRFVIFEGNNSLGEFVELDSLGYNGSKLVQPLTFLDDDTFIVSVEARTSNIGAQLILTKYEEKSNHIARDIIGARP